MVLWRNLGNLIENYYFLVFAKIKLEILVIIYVNRIILANVIIK